MSRTIGFLGSIIAFLLFKNNLADDTFDMTTNRINGHKLIRFLDDIQVLDERVQYIRKGYEAFRKELQHFKVENKNRGSRGKF
jgi:hypothetical protein